MTALPIPTETLSQHVIVLGKTRSGKSSKMRVMVEWLLSRKEPVCIIDPKSDWQGIRASSNGKSAGFPVVIFGGDHADVPINAHVGNQVAELVATGNRPALIDLGGWMVGERTRFFIDFASAFFKHARGRRWLVVDEVHNFAPQVMRGGARDVDAGKALHWANRIASEGSGKGITLIAASQRPAKVSKDLITSCETLIACRVIHPLDRRAIADWIDGCADPSIGKEVLSGLAQMDRSDAWVWSPEIGFGPRQVTWPMFSTYDSFKPQAARRARLKGWAAVDLAEVTTKLQHVVKQAEADDPAKLRKRIAELERELKAKPASSAPAKASRKELQDAQVEGIKIGFKDGVEKGEQLGADAMRDAILKAIPHIIPLKRKPPAVPKELKAGVDRPFTPKEAAAYRQTNAVEASAHAAKAVIREALTGTLGEPLDKCARAALQVLAQFPDGCTMAKIALLAGYRPSGGFRNSLGLLRGRGYIEGGNTETMRITAQGEAQGPFPPLPADMITYWHTHPSFGACERAIIKVLADHTGEGLTMQEIASAAGYSASGGFRNSLGALRTAGVLVGKNGERMRLAAEITG